ncbi:MAG: hypothetical protein JOZ08_16555 [Verrucomicrobia bacterium]|nr:hypothetical protein [Verrucomicrobiota bacterium]MBV8276624.1 hypothetical protein [Verrucomicrobiota bacterium]
MLAYLGKSLTWIITSTLALVAGVGALVLNSPASEGTTSSGIWKWPPQWPPHWSPQWPHFPPPHNPPPAVPEVNAGLVLLPIVLAILVFTSQHLLRRRGLQNR